MRVPATTLSLVLITAAACTIETIDQPPFTGPSELGVRLRLQAIPDNILQDGLSQAVIHIEAAGPDGRPIAALPLRVDLVFEGLVQDFGAVSTKTPVTDPAGRAIVIYTAPPRPNVSVDDGKVVTVSVTPIGTDFRGELARTVDVRLVPPGVVLPPNNPPRPQFAFSPASPLVLDRVVFDASASTDEGAQCGPACTYNWEFGDGSVGTGVFESHQYRAAGTSQVRLTVTDARGASASVAQPLTVAEGAAPTASFVFSPANPRARQTIFLTAEASRASTGRQIVSYDWNFGSGRTGTGVTTTTSYDAPGTYAITLTVTDTAARRATVSQTVTIG